MKIPAATYRLQFTPRVRLCRREAALSRICANSGSAIFMRRRFFTRAPAACMAMMWSIPTGSIPSSAANEEFASLIDQARRHDLGWVQDIVPNHMAYDGQNQMLMDVLENGEASPFDDYFDIDWNHPYESMKAKILGAVSRRASTANVWRRARSRCTTTRTASASATIR